MSINQTVTIVSFNNVGDRDELVTTRVCRKIIVKEDPANSGWPTNEWNWAEAASGGDVARQGKGSSKIFEKNSPDGQGNGPLYSKGERVAFFETVTTASDNFQVTEEM